MQKKYESIRNQSGVTLLELMIVVVIVGIIAAFAYPSYTRYVINTKRTAASSALMQIADRQQQFFMDSKSYAANLTTLGFATDPYVVTDDGRPTVAGDPDAVYSISLSNVAATTYTLTADPLNVQLARDTDCGSLTLNQSGARGKTGPGDNCW